MKNSSFFHKYLAARKRKTGISELINEHDKTLINLNEIEEEIFTFFRRLYSAKSGPRLSPRGINWRPISSVDRVWLERSFDESEIRLAIEGLGKNKAPGPDGFSSEFFVRFWQQLKADFIRLFEEFHSNGCINARLKENFICLIPKETKAV